MAFCKTLKELRKQKNITQTQLSEIIGVHSQTVSKWERGLELPDLAILQDLSSVLEVSIDTLLSADCEKSAYGSFSSVKMGEGIYRLRKRALLTQAELAVKLGVSSDTVSKWERGVILPKIDMLVSVAKFFEVAPSFIYYGVTPKADKGLQKRNYLKWIIPLASLFIVSIVIALCFALFNDSRAPLNNNPLSNLPTSSSPIPSTPQEPTSPPLYVPPTTAYMNSVCPLKNGMTINNDKALKVRTKEGEQIVSATKGMLFWDGKSTTFYIQDEYGYKAVYEGVKLKEGYLNGLTVEIGAPLGTVVKNEQSALFSLSFNYGETEYRVSDYITFKDNMMPLPVKNYTNHFCTPKDNAHYYNETLKQWVAFNGIAFFLESGDEIISCFNGTIKEIHPSTYISNAIVVVENSDGLCATYENILPTVSVGDIVAVGQTLGTVSEQVSYNLSTLGIHLFFKLTIEDEGVYELDHLFFN